MRQRPETINDARIAQGYEERATQAAPAFGALAFTEIAVDVVPPEEYTPLVLEPIEIPEHGQPL